MLAFLAPSASAYRVHTVFCAECTNNFDYKSIAAYWSHNVSGMPGGITRCAHDTLHAHRSHRSQAVGGALAGSWRATSLN